MNHLKVLAAAVAVAVVPIVSTAPASAQFAVLDVANLTQNSATSIQTYWLMFRQIQQLQVEVQNALRNPGQYAQVYTNIGQAINQMQTLKNNLAITNPALQGAFVQQHPGVVSTLTYTPAVADARFAQLVNNRLGSALAVLNIAKGALAQAQNSQGITESLQAQNDTASGTNRIGQVTNNVGIETLKQMQYMQSQNAAQLQALAESEAAKAQMDAQTRADVTLGLQQWRASQANFAQYVQF